MPYAIADMLSDHRDSEAVQMANSMELFTGIAAEELLKSANQILVSGINYGSPIKLDEKLFKKEANEISRDNENKIFGMSDFLRHRLLISPIPYWLAVEDSISMMTSIESRVPYLDHELINVAWKFNKDKFITNSVTKFPLRSCMDSYIPNHVISEKIKFQRPGRDAHLVYNLFKPKLDELLKKGDDLNILETEKCAAKFEGDAKINNRKAAGLWFRILTYLLWVNRL